jgi:hypothetical protein
MTLAEVLQLPLGDRAEGNGAEGDGSDDSSRPPTKGGRRRARLMVGVLAAVVLALVAATVLMLRSGHDHPAGDGSMPTSAQIEDTFGIRFVGAYMTAAGGMVQLQYQILDAEKAVGAHVEGVAPTISEGDVVYDHSGLAGHGHKAKMVAGRTSFLLIANTGGGLEVGDTITIRVGDLRLEGVTLG